MQPLSLQGARRVLCLGAHADDIEIGCGGTVLRLAADRSDLEVRWVVFSSNAVREAEARASAAAFLEGTKSTVTIRDYRDGYLPYSGVAIKDEFEAIKKEFVPDLILTHYRQDLHQDHRLVSDLTWNTWRNHLILEYEIPKFDGDFGTPNLFSPLSAATLERKIALVTRHFASQAGKQWFAPDLFRAVARIRGMECVAPEALAEAFYCRKAVF
ncbi:MAG TPA: PIG-L deacetylase family protein [Myxococcales bacterium]|nr:PIG-L deacetylase family protein [Myxococcales bacterium]